MTGRALFVEELLSLAPDTGDRRAVDWAQLAADVQSAGLVLSAADAAEWMALGFLPGEAQSMIFGGITPKVYRETAAKDRDITGRPNLR